MTDDLGGFMKQAREMQENLKRAQKEMSNMQVTGESGGGLVKIIMNGRHDTLSVHLDDSIENESLSVLADLIAAANNDAVRKVEKSSREKMSGIMGDLQLPDGMNMPFDDSKKD